MVFAEAKMKECLCNYLFIILCLLIEYTTDIAAMASIASNPGICCSIVIEISKRKFMSHFIILSSQLSVIGNSKSSFGSSLNSSL